MVNTAILGSIAAATQLVTLASIESALSDVQPCGCRENPRRPAGPRQDEGMKTT